MGAGKTAVGRALASALGVAFADTDDLVTAVAGPIPEVFELRGEDGFRAVERDVTLKAIDEACGSPLVLALGGGAVLSDDVREALRRLSHVVWLTAPPEVLWRRAGAAGGGIRPLAGDEREFLRLLDRRDALYRDVATVIAVNDGSKTPADLAADLARRVREPSVKGESRAAGGGPG